MECNNKDYASFVNGLNSWEDNLKSHKNKDDANEIYKVCNIILNRIL